MIYVGILVDFNNQCVYNIKYKKNIKRGENNMNESFKSPLYKEARKYIKEGAKVFIWTGYDDPTLSGATLIETFDELKRAFRYAFRTGWPVIRIEKYEI